MTNTLVTKSTNTLVTNGVCWHDRPRRDCHHDDAVLIQYGRARSGRQWHWTAITYDYAASERTTLSGDAQTEPDALAAVRQAVEDIAAGRAAMAELRHSVARDDIRRHNQARQAQRPPSGAADAGVIEYLYGTRHWVSDDWTQPDHREVIPYRVTRKTARRVYYVRRDDGDGDVRTGFADRLALERDGQVTSRSRGWYAGDRTLYATREAAEEALGPGRQDAAAPDLAALKREMADAHPDRGGTTEEFTAARKRYQLALHTPTEGSTR